MTAKTSHRKWLEKMARETDRHRLKAAREKLREAKKRKRSARADAGATCRAARQEVNAWARAERAKLKARIDELRGAVSQSCSLGRERVEQHEGAHVRSAIAKLDAERETQRLTRIARGGTTRQRRASKKAQRKSDGAAITRARRLDSDEQIQKELDTEQLIVWQKVKGQIRATSHASRYEMFMHWLHEHAGDVAAILEQHYQAEVDQLVREEERQRERAGANYKTLTDGQLSERIEQGTRTAPRPARKAKRAGHKPQQPKGKVRPKRAPAKKAPALPAATAATKPKRSTRSRATKTPQPDKAPAKKATKKRAAKKPPQPTPAKKAPAKREPTKKAPTKKAPTKKRGVKRAAVQPGKGSAAANKGRVKGKRAARAARPSAAQSVRRSARRVVKQGSRVVARTGYRLRKAAKKAGRIPF